MTDDPTDEHPFELGMFVRDTNEASNAVVVGTPAYRANDEEAFIDVLQRRVAECASNSDYPDDDPVVEVAYVASLNRSLTDRQNTRWTPASAAGLHRRGKLEACGVTVYSMPASRLELAGQQNGDDPGGMQQNPRVDTREAST